MSARRTALALGLWLALNGAWAEEPPQAADALACGSDQVALALRELVAENMCVDPNIKLADLMTNIVAESGAVTLDRVLTTEVTETPPGRLCEARIKFEIGFSADALGPGPLRYTLRMAGEAASVSYRIGRYDDGGVYARVVPPAVPPGTAAPAQPCWQVQTIENLASTGNGAP
jgi:hypothetical protein